MADFDLQDQGAISKRLRGKTAQMGEAFRERKMIMKCTIQGCPGEYEPRFIVHAVNRESNVLVFENVPAEVCDVCSDMLLAPETIRHLEELMQRHAEPEKHAPVYIYA